MNVDKFSNYMIALLIFLQVVSTVLFLTLFSAFGNKGLLFATVLVVGINFAVFYGVQKITVYDDKGKQVGLGDIFGDVIAVVMITLAVSIILFVVGMIYALRIATDKGYGGAEPTHGKGAAVMLPFLSVISFYGALMLMKNKLK